MTFAASAAPFHAPLLNACAVPRANVPGLKFGVVAANLSAQYPATEAGMLSLFNNAALVRELTRNGPPIAVEVVLSKDASTRSGYAWSSRTGADVELSSGTLAGGTFVVESKRPITLLIPLLREMTGI